LSGHWENKKTVIKGNKGEELVAEYFESKGWVVYRHSKNGAHPFDLLCVKNKSEMMIVEVKTKKSRGAYPDTGIDKRHYDDYVEATKNLPTPLFIAFVDDKEGRDYGNYFSELIKPYKCKETHRWYPWVQEDDYSTKVYFALENMEDLFDLEEKAIIELDGMYQGDFEYSR